MCGLKPPGKKHWCEHPHCFDLALTSMLCTWADIHSCSRLRQYIFSLPRCLCTESPLWSFLVRRKLWVRTACLSACSCWGRITDLENHWGGGLLCVFLLSKSARNMTEMWNWKCCQRWILTNKKCLQDEKERSVRAILLISSSKEGSKENWEQAIINKMT